MAKAVEYKKHSDVPAKYRWDLADYYKGKDVKKLMSDLFKELKYFVEVKDSKYESPESYLAHWKKSDALYARLAALHHYISNTYNINVVDEQASELQEQFSYNYYLFNNELGPELPRLLKHAAKVSKWIKIPAFAPYRYSIEYDLQEAPHVLSPEIEDYAQRASRARGNFEKIFSILTDSERDPGYATTSKGTKIKISDANLSHLLKHDDKAVRKSAAIVTRESFLKNKDTLAELIFEHKRAESTEASLRKFASSVDMLVFGDRVPIKLVNDLYAAATSKQNILAERKLRVNYKAFYKAVYGEAPTKYDYNRDLIKTNENISIEEGIDDTLAALKPLGKEYVAIAKKAMTEHWIDYAVVKNKSSGAYSSGTYENPKKLILMNWDNSYRSVETLAHEIGHSMHSVFSHKANNYTSADYRIFVAEIASIFNELLLNDHWLTTANNEEFRFSVLNRIVNGFSATVFRQLQWSNYEYKFYQALDAGQPLNTYRAQTELYYEVARAYSTRTKYPKYNAKDQYAAIRVPHFYYGFYVHKYAVGQLVANIFFRKYKTEGPQVFKAYIDQFLSKGGSMSSLDTLKASGIDLLDPSIWELGFQEFRENVDEWVRLGRKIFLKASTRKANK